MYIKPHVIMVGPCLQRELDFTMDYSSVTIINPSDKEGYLVRSDLDAIFNCVNIKYINKPLSQVNITELGAGSKHWVLSNSAYYNPVDLVRLVTKGDHLYISGHLHRASDSMASLGNVFISGNAKVTETTVTQTCSGETEVYEHGSIHLGHYDKYWKDDKIIQRTKSVDPEVMAGYSYGEFIVHKRLDGHTAEGGVKTKQHRDPTFTQ